MAIKRSPQRHISSKGTQILSDLESGRYNEILELPSETSLTKAQTGHLNKIWRTKILISQGGSPMPKLSEISPGASKAYNLHYATEDSLSMARIAYPGRHFMGRRAKAKSGKLEPVPAPQPLARSHPMGPRPTPKPQSPERAQAKAQLKKDQSIILVNTQVSPYQAIILQNRPDNIQVNPQSNWVSVKSMGRNNPFMMYTGGETTIQLDLSWYADDPQNYEEVVNKCRLLESWTKANGYSQAPPVLNLLWGTSGLFDGQTFVLVSAPYNLNHFQAKAPGDIDRKLLPACATQTLTLKKVSTDNDTWEDIIPSSKLAKTKGIVQISTSSN